MLLSKFENITSICWNKDFQPFTFDMTKDEYKGRNR